MFTDDGGKTENEEDEQMLDLRHCGRWVHKANEENKLLLVPVRRAGGKAKKQRGEQLLALRRSYRRWAVEQNNEEIEQVSISSLSGMHSGFVDSRGGHGWPWWLRVSSLVIDGVAEQSSATVGGMRGFDERRLLRSTMTAAGDRREGWVEVISKQIDQIVLKKKRKSEIKRSDI